MSQKASTLLATAMVRYAICVNRVPDVSWSAAECGAESTGVTMKAPMRMAEYAAAASAYGKSPVHFSLLKRINVGIPKRMATG